ncbi:hypothetical protein ACW9H6_05880 [Pseudomonas sp. SDO528_S397]
MVAPNKCARAEWVHRNGAQEVDLLRICRKVESFSIDPGSKRVSKQSGTGLAKATVMSRLSCGGNTISDSLPRDSDWTYSESLVPFDPKKTKTGQLRLKRVRQGQAPTQQEQLWRFE